MIEVVDGLVRLIIGFGDAEVIGSFDESGLG